MSLERLAAKGDDIGESAADLARDGLLAKVKLTPGVAAEAIDGGIALTGKALRRRYITDPNLRNIGR